MIAINNPQLFILFTPSEQEKKGIEKSILNKKRDVVDFLNTIVEIRIKILGNEVPVNDPLSNFLVLTGETENIKKIQCLLETNRKKFGIKAISLIGPLEEM